ncbi:hypothetical protein RUM43_003938 [Polyplax serrata]|uniref:Uncharacterized protein n=1 Tax=Polyplax serrata TaxID=468196 RepID=A0AAN8S2J9_POLSC
MRRVEMVWHGHVGNEATQQKVRKLDRRKKGQKGMAAGAMVVGESEGAVVNSKCSCREAGKGT